MSMETIETAMTDRLAEYYREQSRFALVLDFYGESHAGKRKKPCCVFTTESEVVHPVVTKVTLEMELMVQLDDTNPRRASRAAREIEAHLPGALQDLCQFFTSGGRGLVRKCRRVSPRDEIEGERSRVWSSAYEIWIQEYR